MAKRFGLIGDPISHSLSPALFRAAYGGRYSYDLIEGADFEASWGRFLEGYDAINVTAPFKRAALEKAGIVAPEAARIGAANVILKTPEGLLARNTDYDGVVLTLKDLGAGNGEGGNALVIGCGGAGRAAAAAAADCGYKVTLMNRTFGKALDLALEGGYSAEPVSKLRESIGDSRLVIYTASAAVEGLDLLTADDFSRGACRLVLEANYRKPSFGDDLTGMLARSGGTYCGGRKWLLYQAVAAFRDFTGEEPDAEVMEAVLCD